MSFPPHQNGHRFFNPGGGSAAGTVAALKWMIARKPAKSADRVPVEPSIPPQSIDTPSLLVTMVNHATVLLQQPGANILTDPIWAERCSPVPFAGPRRHRQPGVALEHLPPSQLVLLSHNHYDHLDLGTLRHLARRGGAVFVAPLGVAGFLESHGIAPAHQLDWGESIQLSGCTIHSVPAFHFSGRSLSDRDRTLWCGYLLETAIGAVYFAADTGFGPHFGWIRERFGSPRVALLPIGAYEPRWFMSPIHMDPDEAVEAHRILGAQVSIPIHHGTFQLADESLDAPRERLEAIAPSGSFRILDNGESALFS